MEIKPVEVAVRAGKKAAKAIEYDPLTVIRTEAVRNTAQVNRAVKGSPVSTFFGDIIKKAKKLITNGIRKLVSKTPNPNTKQTDIETIQNKIAELRLQRVEIQREYLERKLSFSQSYHGLLDALKKLNDQEAVYKAQLEALGGSSKNYLG